MEHTINMDFNNELCNSIKNKNCKNLQCTHKKKNGELFCGIHLKSGNIEVFKPIINDNIQININENIVWLCENKQDRTENIWNDKSYGHKWTYPKGEHEYPNIFFDFFSTE